MKIVISLLTVLFLAGCTSTHDLMNGRYEVPRTAETRSPFGTNATWVKLENCKKELGQYVDCKTTKDWELVSSQGQGGQVAAGALSAVGLGVLGALMPHSTVQNNSSFFDGIPPVGGHALKK